MENTNALAPSLPVPVPALQPIPGVPPATTVSSISPVLGAIRVLSETQQAAFISCEAAIQNAFNNFVAAGLALAQIRDEELYIGEFDSFEAYYRARWELGPAQVYNLIASAKVFQILVAMPGIPAPDHQSLVRPLFGLPADQAKLAWQCVVVNSGGRRITAQLVRRTLKDLHLIDQPVPQPPQTRQQRYERKKCIRDGFNEILSLLLGKADHDALILKVQALQREVEPLLVRKKSVHE